MAEELHVVTLATMALETRSIDTGRCPRCGCSDVRLWLAPNNTRFRGCRFCGRPRPAMQPAPERKKRSKPR